MTKAVDTQTQAIIPAYVCQRPFRCVELIECYRPLSNFKHMKNNLLNCIVLLLVFLTSCQEKKEAHAVVTREYVKEENLVKVEKIRRGIFHKEILNNGKLRAVRKAELPFGQNGELLEVNIINGQHVKKGQLLAKVEDVVQKYELEKAQMDLDKAQLDLEDFLIGAGYALKDTSEIPKNILNVAQIRSGYRVARANYERAERNYEETAVVAPFSGVVTNLEAKPFNPSTKYKTLCEIIDNSTLDLSFAILETEYRQIKKGLPVDVTVGAFARDTFPGVISCINPSVDANGMIKVNARVKNKNGKLIEGMNARVIVKIAVPNQLVVPKSAVVLRQERQVVFANKSDSTAYWHYVRVTNENTQEVCIRSKNLKPGDEVIVEGNLELGHLTPIVVNR